MAVSPPRYKAFCSAVGISFGVYAFIKTQEVSGPTFEPILEACMKYNSTELVQKTEYHAYEPMLGFGVLNAFVCLITQFLYDLTAEPVGFLVWGTTMVCAIPVSVFMLVEAGRQNAVGPIRYPTFVTLMAQLLGISVMFPLVVVPSYCFGRGSGGVSSTRAMASIPLALPGLILTVLLFVVFQADTYAWTVSAGILGGPAIALTPLLLLGVPAPPSDSNKDVMKASFGYVSMAYAVGGMLSLAGWVYLVFVAYMAYGTDFAALWKDAWGDARAEVAFMTIDAVILCAGLLVVIAFRKPASLIEALVLLPFFGPGATCALVLSGIEIEDAEAFGEKAKTD